MFAMSPNIPRLASLIEESSFKARRHQGAVKHDSLAKATGDAFCVVFFLS